MIKLNGSSISPTKEGGVSLASYIAAMAFFVTGVQTLVIDPIVTHHKNDAIAQTIINNRVISRLDSNQITLKQIEVNQAADGARLDSLTKSIDRLSDNLDDREPN